MGSARTSVDDDDLVGEEVPVGERVPVREEGDDNAGDHDRGDEAKGEGVFHGLLVGM